MTNAFITGAGRGIGEAVARSLARQGLRVALVARTEEQVQRVAASICEEGGTALALRCDVTQPQAVQAAVERAAQELGPLTVLVNNAGLAASSKFLAHDEALWHRILDVNLNSVFYVTRAVLPYMVEANWGRIVNIASIASKVGDKYIAAYTASKHAVLGLTRALAVELNPQHITVNAICPGYVDTPMTDANVKQIAARTGRPEAEIRATFERMSPQNRLIAPEEVAAVAVMLIGEEARGITGQAINIDGGGVMF